MTDPLEKYAKKCATELLSQYKGLRFRVSYERRGSNVIGNVAGNKIRIIVKSISDVSIDEIPIISALIKSLGENYILEFFEYERLTSKGARFWREDVLRKLISMSLEKNVPTLVFMPRALHVSLRQWLRDNEAEALEKGYLFNIKVTNENMLYLPFNPPPHGIVIIAKRNSEASYARVQWLSQRAEEYGYYVRNVEYLNNNKEIYARVFENGIRSALTNIPVNRIAHYIVGLSICGLIDRIRLFLREEENRHLLYGINVNKKIIDLIASGLSDMQLWMTIGDIVNIEIQPGITLETKLLESIIEIYRNILSLPS